MILSLEPDKKTELQVLEYDKIKPLNGRYGLYYSINVRHNAELKTWNMSSKQWESMKDKVKEAGGFVSVKKIIEEWKGYTITLYEVEKCEIKTGHNVRQDAKIK